MNKPAYVDSSCIVALALGEPGAEQLGQRLASHQELFSSNLLEAELRAALFREGVTADPTELLSWVSWFYPARALSAEFERVLAAGYSRGADLWRLACALHLSPNPAELCFLTLDERQAELAASLGFMRPAPPGSGAAARGAGGP